MTEQPGPQQRIAGTIRPAMLKSLQDVTLHGPGGTQHINAWVDWIAEVVAAQVVQPIADERDAFADRVDTLTDVAKRNREAHKVSYGETVRLEARVAELEAEVRQLRAAAGITGSPPEVDAAAAAGKPAGSLRDRLRAKYPATAEALDRRDAQAGSEAGAEAEATPTSANAVDDLGATEARRAEPGSDPEPGPSR